MREPSRATRKSIECERLLSGSEVPTKRDFPVTCCRNPPPAGDVIENPQDIAQASHAGLAEMTFAIHGYNASRQIRACGLSFWGVCLCQCGLQHSDPGHRNYADVVLLPKTLRGAGHLSGGPRPPYQFVNPLEAE